MLKEISQKYIAESKRNKHFRWFSDNRHDLFLWHNEDGEIIRFQFCYDKNSTQEQAVEWLKFGRIFHQKVDDGESKKLRKSSPIFVANGSWSRAYAKEEFNRSSLELDAKIRDFIQNCFES